MVFQSHHLYGIASGRWTDLLQEESEHLNIPLCLTEDTAIQMALYYRIVLWLSWKSEIMVMISQMLIWEGVSLSCISLRILCHII